MLDLRPGFLGYRFLSRVLGSAAYKAFLPSILSTFFLCTLHYFIKIPNSTDDRWFGHPYPLASIVSAFTFLLTFKCSFSYNRYWEACTAIHQMQSKWLDVGIELGAFHMQSSKFDGKKPPTFGANPTITSVVRTRNRTKLMSFKKMKQSFKNPRLKERLWSGKFKAFQSKSGSDSSVSSDDEAGTDMIYGKPDPSNTDRANGTSFINTSFINNANTANPQGRIPGIHQTQSKDTDLTENEPSLFLQEAAHLISLLSAVAFSTLRGDIEGVDIPLHAYTPGSKWPEMDPDVDLEFKRKFRKHNCYCKLGEVIRYLLGFSHGKETQTLYNTCRQFGVLGGVSDVESSILRKARGPMAKTALCTFWLQEFISREFEQGALGKTAPPIVSRLYQFTSDGMLGYNQARKVAYVPFPFPHAQLTTLYVTIMILFLPILMLSYIKEVAVAAVTNYLAVTVFVGLSEVSKELEEPFRNPPNDLALNNFQAQFNEALIAMYAGYHPESWWTISDDFRPARKSLD